MAARALNLGPGTMGLWVNTIGAEKLLGMGDMLFLPPGTSRLMRLHAPYVSEKETAAVVEFWKSQGQAEYVEGFLESPKDEHKAMDGENGDAALGGTRH